MWYNNIYYLLVVQVRYRVLIFKYFRIDFTPWLHVLYLIPTSDSESEPTNCGETILVVHTFHSHFWDFTHFLRTNRQNKKPSEYLWRPSVRRTELGNQASPDPLPTHHRVPNNTVSGIGMVATSSSGDGSSCKPSRKKLRRCRKILPHPLQKRQLMKALATT
jgi:hypothetical protein